MRFNIGHASKASILFALILQTSGRAIPAPDEFCDELSCPGALAPSALFGFDRCLSDPLRHRSLEKACVDGTRGHHPTIRSPASIPKLGKGSGKSGTDDSPTPSLNDPDSPSAPLNLNGHTSTVDPSEALNPYAYKPNPSVEPVAPTPTPLPTANSPPEPKPSAAIADDGSDTTVCKRAGSCSSDDSGSTSSGDEGEDAGGFASDPADIPSNADIAPDRGPPPNRGRDALNRAIENNEPDLPASNLNMNYFTKIVDTVNVKNHFDYSNVRDLLNSLGATTDQDYRKIGIWSQTRSDAKKVDDVTEIPVSEQAMNEASYSADARVIIADRSFKDDDSNPVADQLRWSQLIMAQHRANADTMPGYVVGNLQFIGRHDIRNVETLGAMRNTLQRMGIPLRDDKGDTAEAITLRADADGIEAECFDALSRTPNVRGINWFLAENHNALGNKRITGIRFKLDNLFVGDMVVVLG